MKKMIIALGMLIFSGALKAAGPEVICPSGLQPCKIDASCCVQDQSDCSNCQNHFIPLSGTRERTIGEFPSGTMFTCSDGSSPQKFMAILRQDRTVSEIWACMPVLSEPAKADKLK